MSTQALKSAVNKLNRLSPNIITFIIYGLIYDIVINMYKPFAVKFLTRIGGGVSYISFYNSLPGMVAALILLPGAIFLSRFRNKKNVTSVIFLISRAFLLLAVCVPFFPSGIQPMLFVLLISLMNFPEALSQNALQSSLGSFFQRGELRAYAISLRNKFGNFFVPVITLTTGLIIRVFPKSDEQVIIYYQIFFVAAFLFGIIEIFVFRRFKEETNAVAVPKADFKIIKQIIRDKRFMKYLILTLIFYFTWQGGWAVSSIYQIEFLGADEIWLALFSVACGTVSFFSAGFWSKLINKHGNEKSLVLSSLGMAFNMLFITLSPNLPIMLLASAYSGFAMIGINISLLNGLLAATPDENRMVYIGFYNTFVNISLCVAPLVALLLVSSYGVVPTLFIDSAARFFAVIVLYLGFIHRKQPQGS